MIRFACVCEKVLRAPDEYAGRTTKCPDCRLSLRIPDASTVPEPAERPAAEEPDETPRRSLAPFVAIGFAVFVVFGVGVALVVMSLMTKDDKKVAAPNVKANDTPRTPPQGSDTRPKVRDEKADEEVFEAVFGHKRGMPDPRPKPPQTPPKGRPAQPPPRADPPDGGVRPAPVTGTGPPQRPPKETPTKTPPKDPPAAKPDDPIAALVEKARTHTGRSEFVEARDALLEADRLAADKAGKKEQVLRGEVCVRLGYLYGKLDPKKSREYLARALATWREQDVEQAEIAFRSSKVWKDMSDLEKSGGRGR